MCRNLSSNYLINVKKVYIWKLLTCSMKRSFLPVSISFEERGDPWDSEWFNNDSKWVGVTQNFQLIVKAKFMLENICFCLLDLPFVAWASLKYTKGQLILKANCQAVDSPKKTDKRICFFWLEELLRSKVKRRSFVFLENLIFH